MSEYLNKPTKTDVALRSHLSHRRVNRALALKQIILLTLAIICVTVFGGFASAQRVTSTTSSRGFILTGDIRVDESKATEPGPAVLDIILYTSGNQVFARQRVTPNGRYKFLDVFAGEYYLAIEFENKEIARASVFISATSPVEIKQDLSLEWRSGGASASSVVAAGELYERSASSRSLYKRSTQAITAKNYSEAIAALRQIVASDAGDYWAWSDLGMLYFIQKDYEVAERAYAGALAAKPDHFPALLNQGRVQMARMNYEAAAPTLEAAVKADPKSAAANFFLGESYLQLKKGSKAVVNLNNAIALDPVGMADAHLRLATLYNGANLKDRAAAEYEAFLKVKPDYAERKKLEDYITANKKP